MSIRPQLLNGVKVQGKYMSQFIKYLPRNTAFFIAIHWVSSENRTAVHLSKIEYRFVHGNYLAMYYNYDYIPAQ